MKDPKQAEDHATEEVNSDRRKFLKQAGTAAVTAPAVCLLVSASMKPTEAQAKLYTTKPGPFDDL